MHLCILLVLSMSFSFLLFICRFLIFSLYLSFSLYLCLSLYFLCTFLCLLASVSVKLNILLLYTKTEFLQHKIANIFGLLRRKNLTSNLSLVVHDTNCFMMFHFTSVMIVRDIQFLCIKIPPRIYYGLPLKPNII